jgi:hypothetical protein
MTLLAAVDGTAAIPDAVRVVGVVALASLAALSLVARQTRVRALAVLGTLALCPVLLPRASGRCSPSARARSPPRWCAGRWPSSSPAGRG